MSTLTITAPDMPVFVVPVGVPGSGKSTLLRNAQGLSKPCAIGADDVREFIYGDRSIQGGGEVFDALYAAAIARLKRGLDIVFDNTNLRTQYRQRALRLAIGFDCHRIAVVSRVPLEVALERNVERVVGFVPPERIQQMWEDFERYPVDTDAEMFDDVFYFDETTTEVVFER